MLFPPSPQHRPPARRRPRPLIPLLLGALAVLGVLLGLIAAPATVSATVRPASVQGGSITRSEVLERAQFWIDNPPGSYSESSYGPDSNGDLYRRDCSGFVSMAWHLTSSLNTSTLPNISTQITKDQLLPGDILDAASGAGSYTTGHVAIFAGWTSSAHTAYFGYEFGANPPTYRVISYPYDSSDPRTYLPYRYNNIVDDQAASVDPGAAAVRAADGSYHVFAINSSQVLQQGIYTGGTWSWQPLDGTVYGTPAVTYQAASNRYDVFAPGGNGLMYQKIYTNGTWHNWQSIGGANFASGVQAVISSNGSYHLFATDTNNIAYQGIYTNGTWSWQSLGGAVVGTPAVAYNASTNRYDLFAPGTNGQMYQKTYTNGTWNSWTSIGGANFASGANVAVGADGAYHLFAINSDHLMYQGYNNGSGWTWQNLNGAVYGTAGVLYDSGSNRFDLFAPGGNGSMYQKIYTSGTWYPWTSIGGSNFG